ncbi:hypothetical protein KQI33_14760 [Enterococcus devriesei]|uniref:hypothetical protein n=1 Tax=Enterococcus devriesei TaxID=319970 RepID=UPI001C121742|nr:hypothetical protein [Enterococcus devriesei]MBU5366640.1 hypothetical protein [Enterococcus devriesei]
MKNHLTSSFDYSLLDVETSDFLYEKENILIGIQSRYSREVGKVFFEAQQKLSNKGNGTFEKWYSSIGFKKQNVNNYINIYKNVQSLDEPSAEIFDSLPKSLQNEMSKPSSNQELNQKVFDGDITTHKQYKELEKQLKAKDKQIDNLSDVINDMSVQQPEVVEKEIVIEKIPDDYNYFKGNYEATKKNYEFFKEQNSQLRDEIKSLEDAIKRAPSHEEVNSLQEQLSAKQERELSINKIYEFQEAIEQFTHDHSSILYSNDLNRMETDRELLISFEDSINHLIEWAEEVKKELPNKNIIEGDVL